MLVAAESRIGLLEHVVCLLGQFHDVVRDVPKVGRAEGDIRLFPCQEHQKMAGILQRGICTPGIWPDGLTDFRVLQDDDLPRLKAERCRRKACRL